MSTHNIFYCGEISTFEAAHDKTDKMACGPSKDSNQPGRRMTKPTK